MIRILFTSAGRRVELIQAFRKAACELNVDLEIFGADVSDKAPALYFCDSCVLVPRISEDNYIGSLLTFCKDNGINAVIPTIDTDLYKLSLAKNEFAKNGTLVLVSEPNIIEICRNKKRTFDFFTEHSVNCPKTYTDINDYNCGFPAIIKPKDGSSSLNVFKVNNRGELLFYSKLVNNYIVQPQIKGKEYTVDVLCDLKGLPISIVPRERITVRSGEVLQTKIFVDKAIIDKTKEICDCLKPCGPLTIQLIRDENENDYYIEINPRFGGGAPLSMKAGSFAAHNVINMLRGNAIYLTGQNINDGAIYSRFDQSILVAKNTKSNIKGVIFDLDDTLFDEIEYVKSGFLTVSKFLGNTQYYEKLMDYFYKGFAAIDNLLKEINRYDEKNEILNIYRKHIPTISLKESVLDAIHKLKKQNIKVGIITDGRPDGQMNKIKALKLDMLIDDIIVTDSLGDVCYRKPCDIAYRMMQHKWNIPFESLVYVGDNLSKDFIAPIKLGMKSIHIKNPNGLYKSNLTNPNVITIYSFDEIIKMVTKNENYK